MLVKHSRYSIVSKTALTTLAADRKLSAGVNSLSVGMFLSANRSIRGSIQEKIKGLQRAKESVKGI